METRHLAQGSDEWVAARVGSLGASRIHDAVARTKSGWGASRSNLMAELLVERLTGQPAEKFTTAAMIHGTVTEPEARSVYEFWHGVEVEQVGLIRHPTILGTHASPDGLIGEDGLLELKCPQPATHIDTLLGQAVPEKYVKQTMWQLAVTGRKWCDFGSYQPSLPDHMRLFVKRIHRDDTMIAELETEVVKFLAELDAKLAALNALYVQKEAAE
jgi:putative phage-type endonuclease